MMDGAAARPRVLLVDDDPGVRRLLERIFTREGCAALVASDGGEAIAILETGAQFDLVVTDYNMPRKNGMEVLKTARARLPQVRLVLISSAPPDDATREEAGGLGAELMPKPLDLVRLKGLVPLCRSCEPGTGS